MFVSQLTHQLPEPTRGANGCNRTKLEELPWICKLFLVSVADNPLKNEGGRSTTSADSPSLTQPWKPLVLEMLGDFPRLLTREEGFVVTPTRKKSCQQGQRQ